MTTPAQPAGGYLRGARVALVVFFSLLLASCGYFDHKPAPPIVAPPAGTSPAASAPGSVEPLSRYGNPEFYEVMGKRYVPMKSAHGYRERGIASWYGPDFHGGLTSTREPYDMYQMTGAHKLLPLPTWVEVTNLQNGRKVTLRVNDRGPFKDNRIIDLSYAAALALDVVRPGTAMVEVRAITSPGAGSAETPSVTSEAAADPEAVRARTYLQVGAFGDRANAERLRERLGATFGDDVRIQAEPPDSPRLYKVQVGPVRDVAHADRMVSMLSGIGVLQHHFVNH